MNNSLKPHNCMITTLGCRVNQCESDAYANSLKSSGCELSKKDKKKDICIINTCTVTGKASMQSRQEIRKAVGANPDACIIVTGCYAQTEPDEIKKIKGVDYIIGHSDKHKITELLNNIAKKQETPVTITGDILNQTAFAHISTPVSLNRTRPILKIQDGCNSFCSYCIVPYARGRNRSMPETEVLKKLGELYHSGYKEVVLSGIHIGQYGLDLETETTLYRLLEKITDSIKIRRIRLSSIEPGELTDNIIKLASNSQQLCDHFHVPLQSGDNVVLKKMNRPYETSLYETLIRKIRKKIPDAGIGADVLVGFPGETDEAFQNTYSLVERLPLSYLHVFPFSVRKGTPAEKYPDKIKPEMIKIRAAKMRELGNRKKTEFYNQFINKNMSILIESSRDRKTGLLKGLTSNYIPILVDGSDTFHNKLIKVRIEKPNGNLTMSGKII